MKTIFKTAIAAVALIAVPGAALAQSHTSNSTTYSASPTGHFTGPWWNPHYVVDQTSAQRYANGVGSAYSQSSSSPDDVGTADASANANKQTFTLTGSVNKDCSFYGGGSSSHNIALNTIGIRTQNTDNVSQAFNQAQDITANFNTATAGCNTNNTVSITTAHDGKLLNGNAGDYDGAQFTANIPYGLSATWQGVSASGAGQAPSTQTIAWTAGQPVAAPKTGGAWRSAFNMDIVAPAQSKGLVAGTYEDTITVTLAAS
jgi:hypothetical protein